MKSGLALYQALISVQISEEKAAAVVDALESEMQTQLATKADIEQLRLMTTAEISRLEIKLTVRMGVMLTAAVGVILAAIKYMH